MTNKINHGINSVKALLVVIGLLGFFYAVSIVWAFGQWVVQDWRYYQSESYCVAELISEGVPRSNIKTKDGICYEEDQP